MNELKGQDLSRAVAELNAGKLVAIPTETVYGLAANALDVDAVAGIFKAKNRPSFDPLIVHVSSASDIDKFAVDVADTARKLAESFWPGPLTLILSKQSNVPDLVTAGQKTVGLRMPDHSLTLELLKRIDYPLAAPSANPFGYVSPTSAQHVVDQLGDKIAYCLDGGPCSIGLESTIVKCVGERVEVLRVGGLAIESIEECIGRPVDEVRLSSSNPEAPGMLSSHYNPGKRVVLIDDLSDLARFAGSRIGVISFGPDWDHSDIVKQVNLSELASLPEAATKLFGALRLMDDPSVDVVLSKLVPEHGLGRAINDRLRRSAVSE